MTLQHPIMMMLKKKAYDILLLFHVHIILPIGNIEKYLCSDIRWSFNMTWCYNKKGFPLGCCYPLLLISLFIIIVNQQARTIYIFIQKPANEHNPNDRNPIALFHIIEPIETKLHNSYYKMNMMGVWLGQNAIRFAMCNAVWL